MGRRAFSPRALRKIGTKVEQMVQNGDIWYKMVTSVVQNGDLYLKAIIIQILVQKPYTNVITNVGTFKPSMDRRAFSPRALRSSTCKK